MFRDWLRTDRTAKGVPGPVDEPEQEALPLEPAEKLAIPPELLPILSEQQGPTQNHAPPGGRSRHSRDREPAKAEKPKFWEMKMSDVEWVFLNELYPQFPEAWQYIYERAMFRAGLTPTIGPK